MTLYPQIQFKIINQVWLKIEVSQRVPYRTNLRWHHCFYEMLLPRYRASPSLWPLQLSPDLTSHNLLISLARNLRFIFTKQILGRLYFPRINHDDWKVQVIGILIFSFNKQSFCPSFAGPGFYSLNYFRRKLISKMIIEFSLRCARTALGIPDHRYAWRDHARSSSLVI